MTRSLPAATRTSIRRAPDLRGRCEARLESSAARRLTPTAGDRCERQADLRYAGQAFELTVPLGRHGERRCWRAAATAFEASTSGPTATAAGRDGRSSWSTSRLTAAQSRRRARRRPRSAGASARQAGPAARRGLLRPGRGLTRDAGDRPARRSARRGRGPLIVEEYDAHHRRAAGLHRRASTRAATSSSSSPRLSAAMEQATIDHLSS